MVSRREFLQVAASTAAILGAAQAGLWQARAAQQNLLTQDDLLAFDDFGNVTLLHLTDLHAQLMPVFYREPSVNIGVGSAVSRPPHVSVEAFLSHYDIGAGSPESYALTPQDFTSLARSYGRMGGMDRIAAIIKSVRSARGDKTVLLDGGDTWQGSYTALQTKADDMVQVMSALGVDAMTGHWEFTYGLDRVRELIAKLPFAFLGQNIFDAEWDERAFAPFKMFERGGVKIAVIGQAFPYQPIANPSWMVPGLTFGLRETQLQQTVDTVRRDGAGLVVLLSHNGFGVDLKMASRVSGLDVVLSAHTHDALPAPTLVGKTLVVASGSHGKFVSRLDLDVTDGSVRGYRYKLIPVFADVIEPDVEMSTRVANIRAPYLAKLTEVVGHTDALLYRRGNFNGTFDDVICDALLSERDAEISLSPGFRWGTTVLPDTDIRREDVFNMTAMTYPEAYRTEMTGARLKLVLEDVADNLFNIDPYYQQGGDMVRVGGMAYALDVAKPAGQRISDMTRLRDGAAIDADATYVVAGWASIAEDVEGPPIWDVVEAYLRRNSPVTGHATETVAVSGRGD